MPIAVLKDGPMPGHEIEVPINAPILTLNVGGSTIDFERVGAGEGERIYYTVTSIVERTKTPPKSRPTKRAPTRKVPAATFTGGDSEGDGAT